MISRRNFLKTSGAAAAGSMVAPTAMGLSLDQLPKVDLVVVDASSKESSILGLEAKQRGIKVIEFTDIETLWYGTLKDICCSAETPVIAGLTDETTAFQIEMLAKDAFYYTAFRGRHTARSSEVAHDLRMPELAEKASAMIPHSDAAWPLQLSSILFDISDAVRAPMINKQSAGAVSSSSFEGQLGSWVIAPMNRGRGALS